jgi:hypothetical protein
LSRRTSRQLPIGSLWFEKHLTASQARSALQRSALASVLPPPNNVVCFARSLTVRHPPYPRVTTYHPCALSGSTKSSAGGFVLVSVKEQSKKSSNVHTNCVATRTFALARRMVQIYAMS